MSRVIAGRYETLERLGEGAHGEVWEARDRLSQRVVAVKLLLPDVDLPPARVQLEVAALRLRLPGVVELYDHGLDEEGRPYLVMERVYGRAFPGRRGQCEWADIADVTAALLETLAHVHAAGVLHRDLKPANVLVTNERGIKVLDFGIARRTNVLADQRLTQEVALFGTPDYMAPEVLRGTADHRADLYAVGVMLYQALAGKLPFQGSTWAEIARRKDPVPLSQVAPSVPPLVAQVIEQLLAPDPAKRPRSAAEVLHRLRGEPSVEAPHFPWLGPQRTLRALVAAVQAGRSIDLHGPRGSGRTRCLLALAQALGDRRVVWLVPSDEAFASLAPLVGELSEHGEAPLGQVRAVVKRAVRDALQGGAVLLADDAERLDRASLAVLAACRGEGAIVRAYRRDARARAQERSNEESIEILSADEVDVLTLEPLRERHLRSLFAGPDRLLHLREDAARALHLRTEGLPARVTEEVTRWVRLGVAHWARNHLVVTRETIETLGSGLLLASPIEPSESELAGVPRALLDLLAWLTLAWPHADPALLAKVTGKPLFRVELHLAALAEAGLAERSADGTFVPRVTVSAAACWTEDRLRAAHGALASLLPPGAPGRLTHVWMRGARTADDRRAIAAEAAALGERLIDEGRLEPAIATLERGVRHARDEDVFASAEVQRLLVLWVVAAIEVGTPHALDRVLFEICRIEAGGDLVTRLEELCRAAQATEEFTERPMEHIERVSPFEEPRLERARLSVRALAARHLPDLSAQEEVLREIAAALPAGDASAEATLANHRGRLRYLQGRFREAAALHREAAEKAKSPLVRTYSSVSGALACMDAFAFDEARTWAAQALDLARSLRHAYHEALAEWILRTLAYRQGTAGAPDLELVEASVSLGVKQMEGMTAFNEAAVAYRSGQVEIARALASRAHKAFTTIGEPNSVLLMRCLLIAAGDGATPDEIAALCERALGPLLPGIGLQALALLATAGRLPPGAVPPDRIPALCAAVPSEQWDRRMDILSVRECTAALASAAAATPPPTA